MKFIFSISMLLILFMPVLFAAESEPSNIEIEMLAETSDFDMVNIEITDQDGVSAIQYLDNSESIKEITFAESGVLNVFIWPNLRPAAILSHEATRTGFRRINTVKNKLLPS